MQDMVAALFYGAGFGCHAYVAYWIISFCNVLDLEKQTAIALVQTCRWGSSRAGTSAIVSFIYALSVLPGYG